MGSNNLCSVGKFIRINGENDAQKRIANTEQTCSLKSDGKIRFFEQRWRKIICQLDEKKR